jgi:hypothetical protein
VTESAARAVKLLSPWEMFSDRARDAVDLSPVALVGRGRERSERVSNQQSL